MTNEELDWAVAVGPMGWEWTSKVVSTDGSRESYWWDEITEEEYPDWHPTTDARDTERVMDRMHDLHWTVDITRPCHMLEPTVNISKDDGSEQSMFSHDPCWKRGVCLAAVEATK